MKRITNLYQQVYDLNNLLLAFYKAKKGKQYQKEVIDFEENLNDNLVKMSSQIKLGDFSTGNYTYFTIKDPKERVICAASFPERVYHHALMNIYHQAFDNYQIYHSYATRPNKGTHKALQYTYDCQKQGGWYVKMDVKKFFDTINHQTLKRYLENRFKERKALNAFCQIIDSYSVSKEKGLPIGNLTSQYFANFYLAHLDRYAKEVLCVKRYVRYMDDIVIWASSKKVIKQLCLKLDDFLNLELNQSFKPKIINKSPYPFNYLGFVINRKGIVPNKRNRQKFNTKIKKLYDDVTRKKTDEWQANQNYWILHSFYAYNVQIQTINNRHSNRVLRGGSWNNNAKNCRSANRNNNSSDNRNNNNGFRVVAEHSFL